MLRDVYLLTEVNVLNGVEQCDTLLHRLLESFSAADEPHAASPLVDHRGAYGLREIVFTAGPARVD